MMSGNVIVPGTKETTTALTRASPHSRTLEAEVITTDRIPCPGSVSFTFIWRFTMHSMHAISYFTTYTNLCSQYVYPVPFCLIGISIGRRSAFFTQRLFLYRYSGFWFSKGSLQTILLGDGDDRAVQQM